MKWTGAQLWLLFSVPLFGDWEIVEGRIDAA